MKLSEFLSGLREDKEVEVRDTQYNNVFYFYGGEGSSESLWDIATTKLANMLIVEDITNEYVVVNFSSLIESNYDLIDEADLLDIIDEEDLMNKVEEMFNGDIDECIFKKFVDILDESEYRDNDRNSYELTFKILKKIIDEGETCYIINKDTGEKGYAEINEADEICVYLEDDGVYEEYGVEMLVDEFDKYFDIVGKELWSRSIM